MSSSDDHRDHDTTPPSPSHSSLTERSSASDHADVSAGSLTQQHGSSTRSNSVTDSEENTTDLASPRRHSSMSSDLAAEQQADVTSPPGSQGDSSRAGTSAAEQHGDVSSPTMPTQEALAGNDFAQQEDSGFSGRPVICTSPNDANVAAPVSKDLQNRPVNEEPVNDVLCRIFRFHEGPETEARDRFPEEVWNKNLSKDAGVTQATRWEALSQPEVWQHVKIRMNQINSERDLRIIKERYVRLMLQALRSSSASSSSPSSSISSSFSIRIHRKGVLCSGGLAELLPKCTYLDLRLTRRELAAIWRNFPSEKPLMQSLAIRIHENEEHAAELSTSPLQHTPLRCDIPHAPYLKRIEMNPALVSVSPLSWRQITEWYTPIRHCSSGPRRLDETLRTLSRMTELNICHIVIDKYDLNNLSFIPFILRGQKLNLQRLWSLKVTIESTAAAEELWKCLQVPRLIMLTISPASFGIIRRKLLDQSLGLHYQLRELSLVSCTAESMGDAYDLVRTCGYLESLEVYLSSREDDFDRKQMNVRAKLINTCLKSFQDLKRLQISSIDANILTTWNAGPQEYSKQNPRVKSHRSKLLKDGNGAVLEFWLVERP